MAMARKKYEIEEEIREEIREEMPYPLGYIEKILDGTLRKYGKKLGGFDTKAFFELKTEEIGKRMSQIISDRSVILVNKDAEEGDTSPITYYRSVPIQEVLKKDQYCREIFEDFIPYRFFSTIEHIGIKDVNSDLEMVVTFAGRSKYNNCNPYMRGYISERPYLKPRKRLCNQDRLKVKTRKFFVNAFNDYFSINTKYNDFFRLFEMDSFEILKKVSWDGSAEQEINSASPLLNQLYNVKVNLPSHFGLKFRTEEFVAMIVDYVEK